MSKWIAEFDLEDGDTMPEHMDLNYMGAKIDFHCRPMWIPCSERLPEEDGRYLCTYEDDIYENCVDFGSYENGEWYVDKVIAWMPLPKPYLPDTNIGNMSEIPTGSKERSE